MTSPKRWKSNTSPEKSFQVPIRTSEIWAKDHKGIKFWVKILEKLHDPIYHYSSCQKSNSVDKCNRYILASVGEQNRESPKENSLPWIRQISICVQTISYALPVEQLLQLPQIQTVDIQNQRCSCITDWPIEINIYNICISKPTIWTKCMSVSVFP